MTWAIKVGKALPVQAVEALRIARGWGSHIFRYSAHRWRQGCQPYAPAAFYPLERFLVVIFVWGSVEPRPIVRLEGLGKLKKFTSPGVLRIWYICIFIFVPYAVTRPNIFAHISVSDAVGMPDILNTEKQNQYQDLLWVGRFRSYYFR
jgi:hypothetical protein